MLDAKRIEVIRNVFLASCRTYPYSFALSAEFIEEIVEIGAAVVTEEVSIEYTGAESLA